MLSVTRERNLTHYNYIAIADLPPFTYRNKIEHMRKVNMFKYFTNSFE